MKYLSIKEGVRPVNCPDTFVQWAKEVIYGQAKQSEFNKKISFLKQRAAQKPTLSKIKKTMGEQSLRVLMTKLIADCALAFNVGKNMDLKQAYETSEMILKDFNDWKMPDIQLCFDRAKAGRYGIAYDRIDVAVVMQWCSAYDLERMEDIALANEKKSGEMKGDIREPYKAIKQLVRKELLIEKGFIPQKDSMQHFFNVKYELWERLCEKQPQESGFRFLKRYGKMLSGAEYVKYKLEQQTRVKEYLKNKKQAT